MKNLKYSLIEIKVKEEGKSWQETPASMLITMANSAEADVLCQNIADIVNREVCWSRVKTLKRDIIRDHSPRQSYIDLTAQDLT